MEARRALLCAFLMLAAFAPAANAVTPTNDPAALTTALTGQAGLVTASSFTARPSSGLPTGVGPSYGPNAVPTDGSTFAVLSNGGVPLPAEPGYPAGRSTNLGSSARSANDVTILHLTLDVPANANCLALQFDFFTMDFSAASPDFRDTFFAELDPAAAWSAPSGPTVTAPANFATDASGFVSYLSTTGSPPRGYNGELATTNATGTGYDGALGFVTARTPVTPGSHTLDLSIFDRGDHMVDSGVLVDNLRTFRRTDGRCSPGIAPGDTDFAAPAVTLTAPADGSSTDNAAPVLSGAAGADSGDAPSVSVAIYAGAAATGTPLQSVNGAVNAGQWQATPAALAPGTYTAQATQTDASGNPGVSGTSTFTVTAPAAPPASQTPPPTKSGPTTAQFAATVETAASSVSKSLEKLHITKLLKQGGFTVKDIEALGAGKFVLSLTTSSKRSGRAAATTTLAGVTRVVSAPGRYTLKLKLTAAGKKLLRKSRKLSGTVTVIFTPKGGSAIKRSSRVMIRR
jgi:hypothetical protein